MKLSPIRAKRRKLFAQAAASLGGRLLDLLFPPLCANCRKHVANAHRLCGACWGRMTFLSEPLCGLCGFPFECAVPADSVCAACLEHPPAFDGARALLRYDDASRDPILALKRADQLHLVPAFAQWLERAGREFLAKADLIVPVPLHRWRLWQRRFNQSALVARALSRRTGTPADCLILVRTRATPSQGVMPSAGARRRNVQGAFRLRMPAAVAGKSILLVDDVFTTGATAEACARALKRAGARKVFVLALARVVRSRTNAL